MHLQNYEHFLEKAEFWTPYPTQCKGIDFHCMLFYSSFLQFHIQQAPPPPPPPIFAGSAGQVLRQLSLLKGFYTRNPITYRYFCSDEPDEMAQNAAFYQGLHCL